MPLRPIGSWLGGVAVASLTTSCLTSTVPTMPEQGISSPVSDQTSTIPSAPTKRKTAVTLTISAAASLQDALREVITIYEETNPTVTIALNTASSGALQQQIEQGAPVDVFLSAAPRHMDALHEKGLLLPGTRQNLLGNQLVLVAHQAIASSKQPQDAIASFADLANTTVTHIVMGRPDSVPAGTYSKEVLSSLGLYGTLTPKLVFSKDVRQALTYVESGNVSAGLVYATDAALSETIQVVAIADPSTHSPIVYPVAVLKQSRHPDMAKLLADFLASEQAQAIFERYGFKSL
ncbi:MAG: molybdate ABC transporter substrate-binding protein [Cyanobacteria bacterium P01_F01_bin.150]